MTHDIVEQLKSRAKELLSAYEPSPDSDSVLMKEAANEIERLRSRQSDDGQPMDPVGYQTPWYWLQTPTTDDMIRSVDMDNITWTDRDLCAPNYLMPSLCFKTEEK